jgi:hypothetical protein
VSVAPSQPTGNGLTRLERETALYMLNLLAKYKEADPFRAPVDWEALVRATATAWLGDCCVSQLFGP